MLRSVILNSFGRPWPQLSAAEQGSVLEACRQERLTVDEARGMRVRSSTYEEELTAWATPHGVSADTWSSYHALLLGYEGLTYRLGPLGKNHQIDRFRQWWRGVAAAGAWDQAFAQIATDAPHVHRLDSLALLGLPLSKRFDTWVTTAPAPALQGLRPLLTAASREAQGTRRRLWRRLASVAPEAMTGLLEEMVRAESEHWPARFGDAASRRPLALATPGLAHALTDIATNRLRLPEPLRARLLDQILDADAELARIRPGRVATADSLKRRVPTDLWNVMLAWVPSPDSTDAWPTRLREAAARDASMDRDREVLRHHTTTATYALETLTTRGTPDLRLAIAQHTALVRSSPEVRDALMEEGQRRDVWTAVYRGSQTPAEAARVLELLLQREHLWAAEWLLRCETRWPIEALPLSAKAFKSLLLSSRTQARELAVRLLGSPNVEARPPAAIPPRAKRVKRLKS